VRKANKVRKAVRARRAIRATGGKTALPDREELRALRESGARPEWQARRGSQALPDSTVSMAGMGNAEPWESGVRRVQQARTHRQSLPIWRW
jgi:hypothetical protein